MKESVVFVGLVDDDITDRIQERAAHVLRDCRILQEKFSVIISWNDHLSSAQHCYLIEDFASIFYSVNPTF
jgi:hypothetical protein